MECRVTFQPVWFHRAAALLFSRLVCLWLTDWSLTWLKPTLLAGLGAGLAAEFVGWQAIQIIKNKRGRTEVEPSDLGESSRRGESEVEPSDIRKFKTRCARVHTLMHYRLKDEWQAIEVQSCRREWALLGLTWVALSLSLSPSLAVWAGPPIEVPLV